MMRFIKFMMILAGSVFVMAVFRILMNAIQKGVADMAGGSKVPAPVEKQPEMAPGGELKKCAACGVYNAVSNSVTKVRGGETYYYCSTACRTQHAAA